MEDPHGMNLPGMTRMGPEPCSELKPFNSIVDVPRLLNRPIILLATATITDSNIFSNGLFQNIYLFYRMFEAMGWTPLLIVNTKPKNLEGIPEILRSCRVVAVEDIVKQPIPVKVYMEIGMSVDPALRRFLKMLGAHCCKLYLGNILNIDIETPVFYPGMHFSHHVIGEMQDIWVSPHYGQHDEYASAINNVDPKSTRAKVAPYIWDPCILTDDGRRRIVWQPPQPGETQKIIIMEPNISFQKSSLVPIMAMERWFRKHPDWKGEVHVFNGDRLNSTPLYRESIAPTLDLQKAGKIFYHGRSDIISILRNNPSATFILHQWNNEYNYMLFELFWAGYPVIHNASHSWGPFGYCYEGCDLDKVGSLYDAIVDRHHECLETYKAHARTLAWRHSPYNPEVQASWAKILQRG
jgi:Protein of unknown function (DUF2827)